MEQHMVNPNAIKGMFDGLIKPHQPILELGAGSGNLTRELYQISENITVWELDSAFTQPTDLPLVKWEIQDIMNLKKEDIENKMIISFPPYECLAHILEVNQDKPCILMVSEKKLKMIQKQYTILKTLNGSDFLPISKGIHHIVFINQN
jgi:16S rRNA A1518/A1519 N6-dimethyltransferase RsmA/KsgA/DIM1 with predicted DNA glycosylase/AP lyase activity